METSKTLYFENEDGTHCQALEYYLHDAKLEDKEQITLMEAIPDTAGDYIWCSLAGEAVDRGECKKAHCSSYNSKSGRGVCAERGKLYMHGDKVTFNVETGERIADAE